jgi:hypothetical protein
VGGTVVKAAVGARVGVAGAQASNPNPIHMIQIHDLCFIRTSIGKPERDPHL